MVHFITYISIPFSKVFFVYCYLHIVMSQSSKFSISNMDTDSREGNESMYVRDYVHFMNPIKGSHRYDYSYTKTYL